MIAAIETKYKGYRFRSRLEARWAVFFDHLSLDWRYEPEGYHTSRGPYLPDFFLPSLREGGVWIEVKPLETPRCEDTYQKLEDVVAQTNTQGIIVLGDPLETISADSPDDAPGNNDASGWWLIFSKPGGADGPYLFCVCHDCGKIGLEYLGRGERICHGCEYPHKYYSHNHPKLVAAAVAARSARFEHGEGRLNLVDGTRAVP